MNPGVAVSFDAFIARVRARLEIGAETYGEVSLTRPPAELLEEVQQELEDVAGWSVLLWHQLDQLRSAMRQLEESHG